MLILPGGYCGEATPVPIPNTEVKLSYADGTASLWSGRVGRRQALFCLSVSLFKADYNSFYQMNKSMYERLTLRFNFDYIHKALQNLNQ